MHPRDCEWWEYKNHKYANAVPIRCEAILNELANGHLNIEGCLNNTRPLHKQIFENLTPPAQPYLAGHYRGEKFRCLRYLQNTVEGDRRVGTPPDRVAAAMANFYSHLVAGGLKALSDAFAIPDEKLPAAEKLHYVVKLVCRLLVQFLGIHPYANGNGHMGRLIVWLVLSKFGYWPQEWPLDGHPPYDELLSRYRNGEEQPLEDFVHMAIDGTVGRPPPPSETDVTSGSNVGEIKTG